MCFLKLILGVALFKKCGWQKEKHLINLEHSSILDRKRLDLTSSGGWFAGPLPRHRRWQELGFGWCVQGWRCREMGDGDEGWVMFPEVSNRKTEAHWSQDIPRSGSKPVSDYQLGSSGAVKRKQNNKVVLTMVTTVKFSSDACNLQSNKANPFTRQSQSFSIRFSQFDVSIISLEIYVYKCEYRHSDIFGLSVVVCCPHLISAFFHG